MIIEITKALRSFFKTEFYSIVSTEKKLNLSSFQLYCDFPLLFSQRLFELFDTESNGYLTKKDYAYGFTNLFSSDTHNKINFFFNFFDYNNEGVVNIADINLMMKYISSYSGREKYNDNAIYNNTDNNDNDVNNNYSINEQENNDIVNNNNLKAMTIKQLVDYLQLIDSSCYIIFYSFIYSKKTFSSELFEVIGKTIFDEIQFESLFFQSILSSSMINQQFDYKTIVYLFKACGICFEKYLRGNFNLKRDSTTEDEVDEEMTISEEDELNVLNAFEDDLISIKSELHVLHSKTNHNLCLSTDIKLKNSVIESDCLTKKSTKTSLPVVSNTQEHSRFKLTDDYKKNNSNNNNINDVLFKAQLTKRNDKTVSIKIVDHFIVVYNYIKEESVYDRLISMKSLYIDNSNKDSKSKVVQLVSLLTDNNDSYLTFAFKNQKDKKAFISLINTSTNARDFLNDYTILNEISNGPMGNVQIGQCKENLSKVIIKTLNKKTFLNYHWEVEISKFIMRNPHPYVIQCNDIYDYYDKVVIIYEYIEFGSLLDLMKPSGINSITSSNMLNIVKQMFTGLEYLHSNGIIHRDIKPNNILVKVNSDMSYTIKFIDFGVSKIMFSKQKIKECVGTLMFAAPEVYANIPYSFEIDVWSLGIVIFYLQYGCFPFSINIHSSANEIMHNILSNDIGIPNRNKRTQANCLSKIHMDNQLIEKIIYKTLDKDQTKREDLFIYKKILV